MDTKDSMYATQRLRDFGIGVTQPRIMILDYLDKHRTHPTVDTIYNDLHAEHPSLSRTTVYNNVQTLAHCGALQMLSIDQSHINVDGDTTPHAHLLCTECGKIYDLPLQGTLKEEADEHSFTIEGHNIAEIHQYFKGVCVECLKDRDMPKAQEA